MEKTDLAVDQLFDNKPGIKLPKQDLKKLLLPAIGETHFLFNGDLYNQIDGVAMGSPLGSTLANLFIGHHE